MIAVAVMFLPVHASFADDPLLRLQGFGRQAGPAPTKADCGSALSNLGTPSGGGTLYETARDRACHDVSQRRAALAFAGGLLLVVLGVAGMVRVERAEPVAGRSASSTETVAGRSMSSNERAPGRSDSEREVAPPDGEIGISDQPEPEPEAALAPAPRAEGEPEPEAAPGRSMRRRRRKAQRAKELSRPELEPAAGPEGPEAEAALADPAEPMP